MTRDRVAIVWMNCGPYHRARVNATRAQLGDNFIGVEVASVSSTYSWRQSDNSSEGLYTLFKGKRDGECTSFAIYRAACRLFRERHVRVVFVPSYWPSSSVAILLAAKTVGAATVMMNESHAGTAKARGIGARVKRLIVRQFDAALIGGSPQRRYFERLGIPADRIHVGYDVVDNGYFSKVCAEIRSDRKKWREVMGLPSRYFLSVGRMETKKNLRVIIDAYVTAKYAKRTDKPRIVFVGSGRRRDDLLKYAASLKLRILINEGILPAEMPAVDADLYFFGFRQYEELPRFYALAEAFVLPSLEEEWGLVVNEAMASGLPVIVSESAGCCADLVEDGVNGYRFSPREPEALARVFERIGGDPEALRRFGAASEARIAKWSPSLFAEGVKRSLASIS